MERYQLDQTDAAEHGGENTSPVVQIFDIIEHDMQGRVMLGIRGIS